MTLMITMHNINFESVSNNTYTESVIFNTIKNKVSYRIQDQIKSQITTNIYLYVIDNTHHIIRDNLESDIRAYTYAMIENRMF